MNKNNFVNENGVFVLKTDEMEIRIVGSAIPDDVLKLAEKILQLYPERITAIADCISQDKWIAENYGLTKEQITEKLNKPRISLYGDNTGVLSYCNNEIDCDHILDVEFSGALDEFGYINMDG